MPKYRLVWIRVEYQCAFSEVEANNEREAEDKGKEDTYLYDDLDWEVVNTHKYLSEVSVVEEMRGKIDGQSNE